MGEQTRARWKAGSGSGAEFLCVLDHDSVS
jgi:hypothetical protein